MSFAQWIWPRHHVLVIFLCIMLVFGGTLGWLGSQLLEQDRALEGQRLQERLEQAAEQIVAVLQHSHSELEAYLSSSPGPGIKEPPGGVVILKATEHAVSAYPLDCLLYYPVIPFGEEPPAGTFGEGENLEFQRNDPAKAAEAFRGLTRSSKPGVRAGALLRLGRNLRKTGRSEEALQVYDELARLGPVGLMGLPAELVAQEARCSVLEAMGKREGLRQEASLMYSALQSGRWRLLRPAWEFHMNEARRWSGESEWTERQRNALVLSRAAEWIYDQWPAGLEPKGRRVLRLEARPVFISWTSTADRLASVLAGPDYLDAMWKNILRRHVRGALVDPEGQVIVGVLDKNTPQAVRTTAATRLPWTLHVTSADPDADLALSAARRRLLLSGFGVLALVLLAGSYFILRSIERERAVARLQSEFVSAVSHEFRTPLTSMRQLSEMLSKGRLPTEELRQQSFDILARESERLQRLVEGLLDFGRLEARAFRYHFEETDPAALVSDLVVEFEEKAAAQGYHIEMSRAGEYPLIRADREALRLALWNLLDNAVKYSPDCRTVRVKLTHESHHLAIQVCDHGMGIPALEQKEVFKKFVRGTGSRAANIKGSGIGLAMARNIVEAHDGEIRLKSEPGKGSTFTILLPAGKSA